jgi:hypothetical protein
VKLPDDVIEEAFTIIAAIGRPLLQALRSPLGFCRSNRQFEKRGPLFIRADNKTVSVAAMRVSNPDRSSLTING